MTRGRSGSESGFTLVEMLVALTITLIVSGSIYGLLSGGQSAFRREPELTDRQQNARIAMNLIMRDIANAGVGMPTFMQTFTPGLDAFAAAPLNAENVGTDEIEMISNTGSRDNEPVCHTPGDANSTNVRLVRDTTLPPNQIVFLIDEYGRWGLRNIVNTSTNNTGAGQCTNDPHTQLNFNPGEDDTDLNQPSGICEPNGYGNLSETPPCIITQVSFATVVRYRIRNDAAGVPVLQRWSSDDPASFVNGAPVDASYQTLARGIEDLQVQYTQAATPTTWVNGAPTVTNTNYQTLINQVRVTLVARAEGRNLQGSRTSASGRVNVRGTLTTVGAPRATLIHLANAPAAQRQWW